MARMFLAAVCWLCWCMVAPAQNDETYLNYLKDAGLKSAECAAHSPGELFRIVQQRERLTFGGTTGFEADTVNAFYHTYLAALKPANDARHPKISMARSELRKLFSAVSEAFMDGLGNRSYVTPERIDAYVEHLIAELGGASLPAKVRHLSLAANDTAAYVRARLAFVFDEASTPPDLDQFQADVEQRLRELYKTLELDLDRRAVAYELMRFVDTYPAPVEPLVRRLSNLVPAK